MRTMTYKGYSVGDRVQVKQSVEAYYSIKVPYVRANSRDSYARRGDYFVCVDYFDPVSEQIERAGVRYDNLKRVHDKR